MWRFDLIVTVTVMMMMHMFLHLGGREYYYYVCVWCFSFFFIFSVCERRCVADCQCQRHYSLAALHSPIYAPSRSFQKGSLFKKKKKVELVLFPWMSDVERLDDLMS